MAFYDVATLRQRRGDYGTVEEAIRRLNAIAPYTYVDLMNRRRYSESTKANYTSQLEQFISFINKCLEDVTPDDINRYMNHLILTKQVSIATQNQAINAIKFYFEQILKWPRTYYNFERPVQEEKLPNSVE